MAYVANKKGIAKQCTLHVYIDNSNLYIEGQKTSARRNKFTTPVDKFGTPIDVLWRFDAARLKNVLSQKSLLYREDNDVQVNINLYGSTPPAVETVWTAIRGKEINVCTFARSSYSGKEKLVDHEIIGDAVEQACEDSFAKRRSEFMIVSGDKDMMSAVTRIEKRGFTVHVWGWKRGMTNAYGQVHDLRHVHIHHLDDELENFSYRKTTWNPQRGIIDPRSVVVLAPPAITDDMEKLITAVEKQTLIYRHRVPDDAESVDQDLILVSVDQKLKVEEKDVFYYHAKRVFESASLQTVTYSEYKNNIVAVNAARARYMQKPVSTGAEDPGKSSDTPAEEDSTGWTEASTATKRKAQIRRAEQKSYTQCMYRFYCKDGGKCKRTHTVNEVLYFRTKQPKPLRKIQLCRNNPCTMPKEKCYYAHGEADLFCPSCEKKGHKVGMCLTK